MDSRPLLPPVSRDDSISCAHGINGNESAGGGVGIVQSDLPSPDGVNTSVRPIADVDSSLLGGGSMENGVHLQAQVSRRVADPKIGNLLPSVRPSSHEGPVPSVFRISQNARHLEPERCLLGFTAASRKPTEIDSSGLHQAVLDPVMCHVRPFKRSKKSYDRIEQ